MANLCLLAINMEFPGHGELSWTIGQPHTHTRAFVNPPLSYTCIVKNLGELESDYVSDSSIGTR